MNKLATAMQEGEYDAERPPSKVEMCSLDPGGWDLETLLVVGGLGGGGRNLESTICLEGKKLDLSERSMLVTSSPNPCPLLSPRPLASSC